MLPECFDMIAEILVPQNVALLLNKYNNLQNVLILSNSMSHVRVSFLYENYN